jgi:superfamily II DNA or RNA helicase
MQFTLYNLSVVIKTADKLFQDIIYHFLHMFYEARANEYNKSSYFNKNNTNAAKDDSIIYASIVKQNHEFYLHRRQYVHLVDFVSKYYPNYLEKFNVLKQGLVDEGVNVFTNYEVSPLNLNVKKEWKLYDYQQEIHDYILESKCKSNLIPIQTGKGKTVTSLVTAASLNKRLAIIILPTYISKWTEDITKIYEVRAEDVMVVQGSKNIKALIELGQEGQYSCPITIISLTTFKQWINLYETDTEYALDLYDIKPIDLFPILNIGTLIIDETHQHFHGLYKILLHTNVQKHIGLSATLISEEEVAKRAHNVVYPPSCRYEEQAYDRYCDIYPISYNITESTMKHLRFAYRGKSVYSHTAFEQSISRNKNIKKSYFELIREIIEDYYIAEYMPGDKLMIFVATIDMATELVRYLKSIYTSAYSIERYCEDDPYENVIEPDIRVSTHQSAGTAIDIPNLRVVIQTVSISSPTPNLQNLGRLRKLKDRDVKYCYLYSNNVPQHRSHHNKRMELFKPKAKSIIYRRARCYL